MNFRTELHPSPASYKLNLASKAVTVGSCFSEVMGNKLEKYKVETLSNPFGTIFNPLSACKLLQLCAGAELELADSFVESNGRWYSYDFHSSFSAETEEALYEILDEVIVKTRRFLKKADVLVLTLGTANIYRLNITGETVANCHKLPGHNFTRETLLPEEIITAIAETHSLLRELNPDIKLVLTVSPVRHLKDTLELNSVSKSILRLATHFLTQNLPDISYFPAYELLLDDLRDYRFYKDDLLHPSPMAENYIWEKFSKTYFEEEFLTFIAEWDSVLNAINHKPFHPASPQHQSFIQKILQKLRALQSKTDVTEALKYFEDQVVIIPEPAEEITENEAESETAEEEIIPGYFSDEAEAIAPEDSESSGENPETTEEAELKKRRKKPRKKKKKAVLEEQNNALSEVGTAPAPSTAETLAASTEPAEELAEILADPAHEIEHSGETLSDKPIQKRPLSKSAKRRESRRRKKALEALEAAKTPTVSAEIPQEGVSNAISPEPLARPEATNLPQEQTQPDAAETAEAITASEAKKKPHKKNTGRKSKTAFRELFATETATGEEVPTSAEPEIAVPATEQEITPHAPSIQPETVAKTEEKPKRRGRKPKSNQAEPVKEKIAVPFEPASELEKTEIIAVPFLPVEKLENEAPEVEPPAKPVKKRGRPAKKQTETKETGTEKTTTKSSRKSKTPSAANQEPEKTEKPAKSGAKATTGRKASTPKTVRKKKDSSET